MCRLPSFGRVRRRACGLPYPASGQRSRPSVALHVCFLTGAPQNRRPGRCSQFHAPIPPASSGVRRGGEAVISRPVVRGLIAVVLPQSRSPIPHGRFGHATADYVDRPQAALGSRHRPGMTQVRSVIAPPPFAPPAGDPTLITQVKARTRAKSTTGFSLSKPVAGFKSGYRFSGCPLTSLVLSQFLAVCLHRDSGCYCALNVINKAACS